ncbi:MAG: hypothetical protein IAI50_16085 [Candidatus Eremiobacteraeota bacterium]|nr:hypothetical protein [Candidatus Eremiobacteraeota bacterium]
MIDLEPDDQISPALDRGGRPASSTIVRRRQHFIHYQRWSEMRGLNADVPSASAIAAYIEDHASTVSYLTHRNRIDSLRLTYASRGVPWPMNDSPIRWALESVRDTKGARASRPLSEDELDDLARSMASSDLERDRHDWALIALSSELGLESSDVIRLQSEHLLFAGVDSVSLVGMRLGHAQASTVYAHRNPRRCPVRALRIWTDTRDVTISTFFYFSKPDVSARPLNRRDVNGIVMRRMKTIGRTAQRYSAQSMTAYGLFGRRRLRPQGSS